MTTSKVHDLQHRQQPGLHSSKKKLSSVHGTNIVATDHLRIDQKLNDNCLLQKFTAIYTWLTVLAQPLRDNAAPAPKIRTNSSKESSGISVGNVANYYFHLRNKINKCICIKYVSSSY